MLENLKNLVYEEDSRDNDENLSEKSNDVDSSSNQQIHEFVEDKSRMEDDEAHEVIDGHTDTMSE